MKVRQKLALGFLVAVLCIWATVFLAKNTYSNIHEKVKALEDNIVPGTIAMADMDKAVIETVQGLMEYMTQGKEKYAKKIQLAMEAVNKHGLVHLEHETHIGQEEQKAAEELLAKIQRFVASTAQIIEMKKQGVIVDELMKRKQEIVHPAMVALSQQLKEHKSVHMKELTEGVIKIHKVHVDSEAHLFLIAVLITFFAIVVSFFITRSIVKPIHALQKGTEIIGQGNLDYEIGTKAKDEIGQLSRAFDRMTENLQKSVVSIGNLEKEIVEHKQVEEALRKSEEKYRTLLETTSEGYWMLNPERKTIEINEPLCKMLGYSQDEILGKTPFEFVDDENRKIFIEQTSKISTTHHRSYEITLKKKNGEDLNTYFNATTIRNESGEVQGSFALLTDITERIRSEEELNRLVVAIEQAAESVFITDKDGMIQYINPAFERLTGYSHKDAIGQSPSILKSGKHDTSFYAEKWDSLTRGIAWQGRIVNRKKDGSFYEADATISPVLDKSGKITNFVFIKRDVTNEIELEKRLFQAQKMESIGTLAGGIAHDFNNILFSIMGYTELALDDTERGAPLHNNLQEVLIAAHCAKDLVKQILTFSRQADQELKPLKIQLVVREVLKLIKVSLPSTIEININISNICGLVMADAAQIHRVAMNLLTNAYHAMADEGGKLDITLKEVELDVDDLKDPAMFPGSYVCLTVADTGTGIDNSVIDRIFEPYFSTKEKDKGTGLGLATVYGIVKSYGGNIRVYSEPGKGSVFHVYLPVVKSEMARTIRKVLDS